MHEPPSINAADVLVYGIYVAFLRLLFDKTRIFPLIGCRPLFPRFGRTFVPQPHDCDRRAVLNNPQRSVNYCGVRKWVFRDTCLRDGSELMLSQNENVRRHPGNRPRPRPDRRCLGIAVVDLRQFQYCPGRTAHYTAFLSHSTRRYYFGYSCWPRAVTTTTTTMTR